MQKVKNILNAAVKIELRSALISQCRLCAGFWGVRLGALEVSVSLRYVPLPPVIWPQSPHLVVKGLLKLLSMYLAHTSIPNF